MFDRKGMLARARVGVAGAIRKRDNLLVQTVGSIDELNKCINLMCERLTEWYGVYFPEFRNPDAKKYAQIVLMLDRANPDEEKLREILGPERAGVVVQKAQNSMGANVTEEDLQTIRALAYEILKLKDLLEKTETYQNKLAQELAPNVSHVAGQALAAKLVAAAGSVERLAMFPASTIQVIGAEKALFKHLKSGSPPPKHGLIFQHPLISTSPKKVRGKIARALSTNLAIAAKADGFSKNFIAPALKERFMKRVDAILAAEKTKQQNKQNKNR